MSNNFEEVSIMADKFRYKQKEKFLSCEEYQERKKAISFGIASSELEGNYLPESARLVFARYIAGEISSEMIMKEILYEPKGK